MDVGIIGAGNIGAAAARLLHEPGIGSPSATPEGPGL